MDKSALLYAAKLAVLMVFSAACFWRAWEDGLQHHAFRLPLIALGAFCAFQAATIVFRLEARMIPDLVASRAVLDSWWFWLTELGATLSAVWLFFLLQKPRSEMP